MISTLFILPLFSIIREQLNILFLINLNKNTIFVKRRFLNIFNPKENQIIFMEDINPIYHNPFGVAFQWKRSTTRDTGKIQIVFRDTGLLLTHNELEKFQKNIECTMKSNTPCVECHQHDTCRSLLLDTPAPQITLAMNSQELNAVQDLVDGTLFQLNLNTYLDKMCGNKDD